MSVARCSVCGFDTDTHRHLMHADLAYKRMEDTGWEDGFTAVPDGVGRFEVIDAECERVCSNLTENAAEVIAAALSDYFKANRFGSNR